MAAVYQATLPSAAPPRAAAASPEDPTLELESEDPGLRFELLHILGARAPGRAPRRTRPPAHPPPPAAAALHAHAT